MKKFQKHTGIIAPINIVNIDTDIIIPKQFLKSTKKTGFGKHLFHNWRYIDNKSKKKNKSFVLNKKKYKNTSILITGENFGCGSSREHAVWALIDYGIKVIISSQFADIFYNNSVNNNLLLIQLNKKQIQEIFSFIKKNKKTKCIVNLLKEKIYVEKIKYHFSIDKFYKFKLINGLDKIDLTLKKIQNIIDYEKKNKLKYLENRKLFS
ncbi:3-isopropylmalate dehydratase small subunit [Buchnera aphidicola]|uniref:3-isopropylmalate dehydratase small subunit n=1 Tax=Buchnera aphidicola TaxID=9 RepID=UPI002092B1F0|nr:3-isopropylmalate dehydratase small subunit [Buchnera aphidicola]USS94210.1 3-isopropylmalate dehydratase small subunit [Buchnera aphidicola (Sipha maydis)]WII23758.1 3-isopropylmalate dehydratase small subunit [Buchnera aphidicola (Sipha maydis)]